MRLRPVCMFIVFLTLVLLASPAFAQADAETDELRDIDEIVVNITKRTESLQEVSGTFSVFDSSIIRETNIERIADAVALIPNVQIKGGSNQSISIRGISQSIVSQSPVARHVNGVFKFDNEAYTGHFYDLENIQVARGPSGTVYGRNATAGAIDLQWKQPHDEWEVFGDITLANTDRYHFRGGVNIPFLGEGNEKLMGRLVIQREIHDGWVDNELTTRNNDPDKGDDFFARFSLKSVISEDTEVIGRGYYHRREDGIASSTPVLNTFTEGLLRLPAPLGVVRTDPFNGYTKFKADILANPAVGAVYTLFSNATAANCMIMAPACPDGSIQTPDDALEYFLVNGINAFGGIPGFFRSTEVFNTPQAIQQGDRQTRNSAHRLGDGKLEVWGFDGQFDTRLPNVPGLGDVGFTLIGGWEHFERNLLTDLDGTELLVLDVSNQFEENLYTAEFRFSSEGDGPVNWIAGFFWFTRDRDSVQDTVVSFVTPEANSTVKESGFAPFINIQWDIIDSVTLEGGVRWNRDRFFIDRLDPATSVQPFDLQLRAAEKFRETTYEAKINWEITEDHHLYAKFAHGYKGGLLELDISGAVAQLQALVPPESVNFKNVASPELIDAFEVGLRTQWLDGMITANLTAFYYDYTDLQVTQITGAQILTENAGEATIQGLELELVVAPTENWLIMFSAGYLDAEFDTFCSDDPFQFFAVSEPGCAAPATNAFNAGLGLDGKSNLAGNRLEDSPEFDLTFVTRYTIALGEWGTLTPVVEFQWTDEYFSRPYNLPIDKIASRSKTDLRLIWEDVEKKYSVELFVENLENETVFGQRLIGAEFQGGFPVQVGTFPPRIYGIRLGFHFGGDS